MEAKDQFYEQLERAYAACPSHDVKLMMVDPNAKVGRETVHQPTIGKHSLHESTNENGLRLVDFAAGRKMAIKGTYFMHKRIHLQNHYCLIDGRHFSDVIDVMARSGANIDSDYMLVVFKLRARICRANPEQLRRFAVERLKDRDVASRYYDEHESELQGVQAQRISLNGKCKKLEETIQRVATNTINYTRLSYDEQTYKQPAQSTIKKHNYSHMPMI
jgi:hypothetical protein